MIKLKLSRRILRKIKRQKGKDNSRRSEERMADTKKRENDESDSGNERKKVRRSTSDTIDILHNIFCWSNNKAGKQCLLHSSNSRTKS